MPKKIVEEIVHTSRHRYEVRRVSDGLFSDVFQVYRVSGGEKYIGVRKSLSDAIELAHTSD